MVIGPAHGNRLRGGMHKAIAAAAVLLSCMKAGRSALTGIFFACRHAAAEAFYAA